MGKMDTPGEWVPGLVTVDEACATHGIARKAVESRRVKVKDIAPGMKLLVYEVAIVGTYDRAAGVAE